MGGGKIILKANKRLIGGGTQPRGPPPVSTALKPAASAPNADALRRAALSRLNRRLVTAPRRREARRG